MNVRRVSKAMTDHIRTNQSIACSVILSQLQQAIRRGTKADVETTMP